MTSPRTRRITRSALLVSSALIGLVACGGTKDAISERVAERAIEQAAGGDVDVRLGDDGQVASIQTEDGSLDMNVGGEVPDEWPADVPLFDGGDLTASQVAVSGGQTIVSLTYGSDLSAKDAVAGLNAAYESAGFTTTATSEIGDESGGLSSYIGERDGTTITVSATFGTDDPTAVILGVVYPVG